MKLGRVDLITPVLRFNGKHLAAFDRFGEPFLKGLRVEVETLQKLTTIQVCRGLGGARLGAIHDGCCALTGGLLGHRTAICQKS